MTISVADVRWSASGRMIVDGITLEVASGRMLGLIGPNGSGKSSLLRLICRLRRVRSGVIRLGDDDLSTLPRAAIAKRIAFVEQQAATEAEVTVRDVVRLGRTPHRGPLSSWTARDEAAVAAALQQVDMAGRLHQLWRTLSGGERQRVHIARALAQSPTELLLDEPTNHLDIQHQLEILALVARLPVTAIVALHDLNLAAMFCDRIAVLRQGRVVCAGEPGEVLTAALIGDVFGVSVHVGPSVDGGRPHVQYLGRVNRPALESGRASATARHTLARP